MHDINRYDQQRPIGSGACAEVFRVFDPVTETFVAMKKSYADANCVVRAKREVDFQRRNLHGNIMRVLDWAEDGSWFTMPLANGDLGVVHERAPLAGAAILRLVEDVASALDVAHRRGFVHRDLSPSNVLWMGDRWVVADWAFVKGAQGGTSTKLTRTGVGTPLFTAPEVFADGDAATPACDVYSLGRLVAWLLGSHPLEQNRETRVDEASPWAAFVRETTRLDPAERPQSVADSRPLLTTALEAYSQADESVPLAAADDLPDVTEATVAFFKRLLQEPSRSIDLEDLLDRELEGAGRGLTPSDFPVLPAEHGVALNGRLHRYVAVCRPVMALLSNGVAYGGESTAGLWTQAVRRIAEPPGPWSGVPDLLQLRRFPLTLIIYTAGVVAVARGRWRNLHALLVAPRLTNPRDGSVEQVVSFSAPALVEQALMRTLPNMANKHTPLSDWLFAELREPVRRLIRLDSDYEEAFDQLEILLTMLFVDVSGTGWLPVGRFGWKDRHLGGTGMATRVTSLKRKIDADGEKWGPIEGGLFPDVRSALVSVQAVEDFTRKLHW